MTESAPLDSITCLEWARDDRARVTCSGLGGVEQTLAIGGRWDEGETSGWYRLILTEAPPAFRVTGSRSPALERMCSGSNPARTVAGHRAEDC